MRFLSKFWIKFVDHTDALLDLHCSLELKGTDAERASAPSRFRNWRPRMLR
jgi:hypothetical protein